MRGTGHTHESGLTRLESTVMASVLLVGLVVGAGFVIKNYSVPMAPALPAAPQPAQPLTLGGPVTVNVPAAGTVVGEAPTTDDSQPDACPDLRGDQPAGFDCTLPLFTPALDLSAVRIKGRYQCADPVNYRLVKGQTVQWDKKCVLKTATAGRS